MLFEHGYGYSPSGTAGAQRIAGPINKKSSLHCKARQGHLQTKGAAEQRRGRWSASRGGNGPDASRQSAGRGRSEPRPDASRGGNGPDASRSVQLGSRSGLAFISATRTR
ncbi:hypothetical protein B8V81_2494 [Paenibacillus pasadenensis]|uniref:Uncharacterized protein n=1 Tax=Paenibacillus pasadenensis TaxID=217090 RepID=A0A2N5N161_9BACL|nr:hypothetical protein B8V81_2494 [Paenibacillus pasadenensis]